MFAKVFDKVTGLFDSQLLLGGVFPTLALMLAVGALITGVEGSGWTWVDDVWTDKPAGRQIVVAVGAVAAVIIVGYVVMSSVVLITQLFEGYRGPAAWLDVLFRGHLRAYRKGSDRDGTHFHPRDDKDALPTTLGNALRAAELYPRDTYGMDAVVLWPRLSSVAPAEQLKAVQAARAPLDLLVIVAFYSFAYAIFAAVYVAVRHGGRLTLVLAVGSAVGLGILCYFASVQAAIAYGDQVRSVFDNYRFDLLKQLRLPLPNSVVEERRLWSEVNELVRSGSPPTWWVYAHPVEK
jgi:hypothetical protein